MSDTFARAHDLVPASDRRAHARQLIPSLAYVELDEGNGGIILNISEGGLSVQAVAGLMDDFLPGVRFQLAETDTWIETNARITWANETRKLAGLEFLSLSEDSRELLRKWLLRDAPPAEATVEAPADLKPEDASTAEADAIAPGGTAEYRSEMAAAVAAEPTASSAVTADVEAAPIVQPEAEVKAASALADLMTSVTEHGRAASVGPKWPLPKPAEPAPAAPAAAPALTPFAAPADPPAPIEFPRPVEEKSAAGVGLIGDRWSAGIVLVALAVGSLAAGWVAGQGQLSRVLAELHGGATEGADHIRGAIEHLTNPPPKLSDIEIENAGGQRWTIPFNGPLNSTAQAVRHPAAAPAPGSSGAPDSDAHKAISAFRTWILTPPQQTHNTTDSSAEKATPPAVPDSTNTADNVISGPGGHPLAPPPSLPVPQPPTPTGVVKQGQLIYRVDPAYPSIAKEQHAEGTVRLNVTVGTDGTVLGVSLLGGPRLLVDAAERAVRQWRYTPTLLDGKPVEFQREVDLTFRLSAPPR